MNLLVGVKKVIIVEDENGNIIRERVGENVDAIQQYTILRDTLLLLTRIDPTDTRDIMLEFLDREVLLVFSEYFLLFSSHTSFVVSRWIYSDSFSDF